MKVPRTQTHRAAQRFPGWWIGGAGVSRLSGYNMESLPVDHSG